MGLKEVVDSSAKYNHWRVRPVTRFVLDRNTIVTITTGRNRLGLKEPVRQLVARIQSRINEIEYDEMYPRREESMLKVAADLKMYAAGERKRTTYMNRALTSGGSAGVLGSLILSLEPFGFAGILTSTVSNVIRGIHANRRERRIYGAAYTLYKDAVTLRDGH